MPSQSIQTAPDVTANPHAFCRRCGYALIGISATKCPECGRSFDPSKPRTFARRPPRALWRWIRRLAGLILCLTLIVGLVLGWFWYGWHREQQTISQLQHAEALIKIKQIGPSVLDTILGKRLAFLRDRVYEVQLFNREAAEIERLDFSSLKRLETLTFLDCRLNNGILSNVSDASNLHTLHFGFDTFDKPDLACLAKLSRLTELGFWKMNVNDAGISHVGDLTRLKVLHLDFIAITDGGLESVEGLSELEELHLVGAPITDAGLAHLRNLKSLRVLDIHPAKVSAASVERLKQSIPNLDVRK
jgi:hypothetical protein